MTDLSLAVRQILAQVLNIDEQTIDESSSRDTIESWDSLQHLNLVLSLEEAFGIQLDADEITSARTFPEVLDLVRCHVNGSSAE